MEKKQMLTGIFLIPKLQFHENKDAVNVTNAIVHQLGALNCEPDDESAMIRYNGILNRETKEILNTESKKYAFSIMYVEAEQDTPFIDCDTFRIPTNDEMKTHLNLDEKVNHP